MRFEERERVHLTIAIYRKLLIDVSREVLFLLL